MPKGTPVNFSTPVNTSKLKDKSILITGGASGIGLACAKYMAKAGASVTIADMQEEAGAATAKDLSSKGLKIQFVHCDVVSFASQVAAFKSAVEFGGNKLDIVVPSAGIIAERNLFDMAADVEPSLDVAPPEPGFSAVDVNLKGVYYSSYLALHYFRIPRQPDDTFKKSLILIASIAGYLSFPPSTTYSMSKFGVRGLFWGIRSKASEQDPPVRVNLVGPWFVETPMIAHGTGAMGETSLSKLVGYAPMEGVVDAVVRLGVDESVHGRAVGCMPGGNVDFEDELGNGGVGAQKAVLNMVAKAHRKMDEAGGGESQ